MRISRLARRAACVVVAIAGLGVPALTVSPAEATHACWANGGVGGGVYPVSAYVDEEEKGAFVCYGEGVGAGATVGGDEPDPAVYQCSPEMWEMNCERQTVTVPIAAALPPRARHFGMALAADPLGPAGAEPHCSGIVVGSFQGVQDLATRVISGQWQFSASMECNRDDMDTLHVEAILYDELGNAHNGSIGTNNCFGGPLHPGSGSCRSVSDAGIFTCFVCNGTWFADGEFTITLPVGWIWLPLSEDGECRIRDPRTLHCSISTGPMVLQ